MIGDLFDSPWKILILAVVILVMFGSRKLPDAARSLGKSMRILKTEISTMHEDGEQQDATAVQTATAPPSPAVSGQQAQVDQLQAQIDALRLQASAAEAQQTPRAS
jgi:sec-independent protein translocase protein TatA